MFLIKCIVSSALLMIADGLSVKGPSATLVVPVGGSVVLNCSSDELLPVEDLEVEWKTRDSETLVQLFLEGESREEVQQQEHQGRAHFFTDQIPQGNFSLLLERVRAEDQGEYTCKVYSGEDSAETVVQIRDVERLMVSGSDVSVSAYVGEDVTLNCSVDSHEDIDEVSWKKREKDGDVLVLLYQDSEVKSDSSDERYRDRVQFFSAETSRGNFSVRLKSVRTEDKGVYMCQVFSGDLQANATVTLNRLGFSVLHKIVLILCLAASGSALIFCGLIFSGRTDAELRKLLHVYVFICPNILLSFASALWGFTEGVWSEAFSMSLLCVLRSLRMFWITPQINDLPEDFEDYQRWFGLSIYPNELLFPFVAAAYFTFLFDYFKSIEKILIALFSGTLMMSIPNLIIMKSFEKLAGVILLYSLVLMANEDDAYLVQTAAFLYALWTFVCPNHPVQDQYPIFKKAVFLFGSVGLVCLNSAGLMADVTTKAVYGERLLGDLRILVFLCECTFSLIQLTFCLISVAFYNPVRVVFSDPTSTRPGSAVLADQPGHAATLYLCVFVYVSLHFFSRLI